jgi:hypothetical protein
LRVWSVSLVFPSPPKKDTDTVKSIMAIIGGARVCVWLRVFVRVRMSEYGGDHLKYVYLLPPPSSLTLRAET